MSMAEGYTPIPDEIMDAANLSNSHFNTLTILQTELDRLKAVKNDRYSMLAVRIDNLDQRVNAQQQRFHDAVEWTGILIGRGGLLPEVAPGA